MIILLEYTYRPAVYWATVEKFWKAINFTPSSEFYPIVVASKFRDLLKEFLAFMLRYRGPIPDPKVIFTDDERNNKVEQG